MQETVKHLKQLATESAIYGFAGIISSFLGFFTLPIYTRIFAPTDFGVMSLVTNTMTLLTIFIALGMDNAAYRWYWDNKNLDYRKSTLATWAWCQITIAVILSVAIFAFSRYLGVLILQRNDGWIYFSLSAVALPLSALSIIIVSWFRMQRRPMATVCFSAGIFIFNILFAILLVVIFRIGLSGVYIAQIIVGVCGTIIAVALLRDWINPKRFSWLRLKEMFRYGAPMIPAGIAYWMVNLSGCYFIRFFSSMSEVGLFQVGASIATAIALITGAFQQAWGPFAISIHTQSNAKRVYAHTLLAYVWISCLLSTSLFLFSPEILRIFTTKAYSGAKWVIGITAFNYVIIGLGYIAALGSNIAKTTKPIGVAMTISAIFVVVLSILLVPRFGKEGSAIASLISQLFVPAYVFYSSQKLYYIPYRFSAAALLFLFALVISIFGVSLSFRNPFIGISVKILLISLFIPMLFFLKIIKLKWVLSYFQQKSSFE